MKTASGSLALTPEQQHAIYDVPDKTFADYSPDVRDMTLAERASLRDSLSNELKQIRKRMKDDDDAAKAKQLKEQESALREKILSELSADNKQKLSENS